MVNGIFSIQLEACDIATDEALSQPQALPLREYVGSQENRLVKVAAEAVLCGEPRYCPTTLYGPTGTGKTMLALGLADRWRAARPASLAIATCGADFARHYAIAVDTDAVTDLRQRFRSARLLVLDNLHELYRKPSAQAELARTLDALQAANSDVLVTSARAPHSDKNLLAALRSRLTEGLVVPLAAPGVPARRLLLRRLAELHAVELPDAAVELLAANSDGPDGSERTVPRLNQAVLQLGHTARTENRSVTIELVQSYLADDAASRRPALRLITDRVSRYFSVTAPELRGPSRRRNVVRARGVAMYLAWHLAGKSLDQVGRYYGKRDHTTVLHACRKTERLRQSDPDICRAVDELTGQLNVP